MVLDRQGGPNWFKNWCVAPVIVDPKNDEVYFTPIYYVLSHFSKFIRPGAKVLDIKNSDKEVMVTAAKNINGSVVVVVFNPSENNKKFNLQIDDRVEQFEISNKAIQSIVINHIN